MENHYIKRLLDEKIEKYLNIIGCILIVGPKWCGKSTTAERYSKSVIKLQNPNIFKRYQLYALNGDHELLKGDKPILFDEWQKLPDLWDYIRENIDSASHNEKTGRFILTGSTQVADDENRHTGVGRIVRLVMRPMSLWESGDSNGSVSLLNLFNRPEKITGTSSLSILNIAQLICRGGFPENVINSPNSAFLLKAYYATLVNSDINAVDGKIRNPIRMQYIMRSYARNICSLASNTTLLKDIEANDTTMDLRTLSSYIVTLEKLYIIENIPSWSPKLRSKTAIRTTAKRQFVDPSLAVVALDAGPEDLLNDIKTFGFLFESLVQRDLKIYADNIDASISHYRDKDGLEIDSIIHLNNGLWGAIEIKLGGNEIDEAASNLLKLKEKIDLESINEPSFLAVITGLNYSYKREDGIYVISIGCLKN